MNQLHFFDRHRRRRRRPRLTPEEAFEVFHQANPHVYELFKRFTHEVRLNGLRRYSARAVIHRIRWHVDMETDGQDGFKINDHHSPYYARLWERDHPDGQGFFETRGTA